MQYSCLLPQGPYLHAAGELKPVPCWKAGLGRGRQLGPDTAQVNADKWRQAAYSCPTAQSSWGHAASWNRERIWPYKEEVNNNNIPSTDPCPSSNRPRLGPALRETESFSPCVLLTWTSQTEQLPLLSVPR